MVYLLPFISSGLLLVFSFFSPIHWEIYRKGWIMNVRPFFYSYKLVLSLLWELNVHTGFWYIGGGMAYREQLRDKSPQKRNRYNTLKKNSSMNILWIIFLFSLKFLVSFWNLSQNQSQFKSCTFELFQREYKCLFIHTHTYRLVSKLKNSIQHQ